MSNLYDAYKLSELFWFAIIASPRKKESGCDMELPSCGMEISNTNLMSIYDSEGIISEGSNLILRNVIYVSFSVYYFFAFYSLSDFFTLM